VARFILSAHVIALAALAALGSFSVSFHETSHADSRSPLCARRSPRSRRPGCLSSSTKSKTPSPRLVYLTDIRSERVVSIQVTWIG
jgi:hypothetical protein